MNDALRTERYAALRDAGYTADEVCLVIVDRERVPNANMASHIRPLLHAYPSDMLEGEDLARANAPGCLEKHRVVIWRPQAEDAIHVALFAAKVRHELEHARQWDAAGTVVFDLDVLSDRVLWDVYDGASGSAQYYNQKPIEADANAAASRFVRNRFSEGVLASLAEHDEGKAYVREADPPGDPSTLIRRTLEFLREYREALTHVTGPFIAGFLDTNYGHAVRDLWRQFDQGAAPPDTRGI